MLQIVLYMGKRALNTQQLGTTIFSVGTSLDVIGILANQRLG